MMKKLLTITIMILTGMPALSDVISGEIKKERRQNINQIYDSVTNNPIEGVIIKIPSKNYETRTKKDGSFKLGTKIDAPTIMSVAKSGYKPYSLTLNQNRKNPIQVGIEKTTPKDIIVETDMIHIGDDSFSSRSANAGEFSLNSAGYFYTKDFNLKPVKPEEELVLVIGSIIGIDTLEAQKMGQSRVLTAYSSPPEVYFNGSKIAEIKINADGQKINIPKALIKPNNNVTIRTGHNLYKVNSVDYDDIEFTNLLLEIK